MVSYSFGLLENTQFEEELKLKKIGFRHSFQDALELERISSSLLSKGETFDAAWTLRVSSYCTGGNPEEREKIFQFAQKSLNLFNSIFIDEKKPPLERAISGFFIPLLIGRYAFSTKLGGTPLGQMRRELYPKILELLEKVVPQTEPERFDFLFRDIKLISKLYKISVDDGLYEIAIVAEDYKKVLKYADAYLDKLYYGELGWYFVCKSYVEPKNSIEHLHKASDFFFKDTHDNYEKHPEVRGKVWSIANVELWGNYYRALEHVAKVFQTEENKIENLRLAVENFNKSGASFNHPPSRFYALICETLANFLEDGNIDDFTSAEDKLSSLIGEYCKDDERFTHNILNSIKVGFEACIEDRTSVSIENKALITAFKLIDQISDIYLKGLLSSSKKSIVEQAALLLSDNLIHLKKTIDGFDELLCKSKIKEIELQTYLLRHPILFGAEYAEINPKHKLGNDYEMDYALKTYNEQYHLVEIEKSTDELYTRRGDPRATLTHAEQQVLDWLRWLDEFKFYAKQGLVNIITPKGYVIIGRSSSLTPETQQKLIQRNILFANKIVILTYDDLLKKAKTLLTSLTK